MGNYEEIPDEPVVAEDEDVAVEGEEAAVEAGDEAEAERFPHGVTLLTPWVLGSTLNKFVSFAETEASLILDPTEAFPVETRSWMKKSRLLSKLEMKKLLRKLSKNLNAEGGEDDDCSKKCFALHGEIFSLSI